MSNPRHYLYLICIFLVVVAIVCALLYVPLKAAFMANWGFNFLILGALGVGIGINMHQVLRLEPEIKWMQMFRTGQTGISVAEESPVLLKPLTKHLSGIHRDRFRLSALSLRTVLEGIRGHLDESREISSYMIGLLIFLGLLGTFWGLLGTITAVVKVIGGLEVGSSNYSIVFETLKAGLQEPLKGMGTAFSSSLFGLGGSLVLGFIDIQAGHAQNRFFNEMEEWLSGVTQLIDKGEKSDLEQIAQPTGLENIEDRLEILVKEIQENQRAVKRLIDGQEKEKGKDLDTKLKE
ncbi:biopolymer transporter ExbB [Thermodesulfobacteriota bacterium]